MIKKQQAGFSLLEIMIVIAIVSLLMTLAIPSYQRYTQRAKFTEVIQATGPYKLGITLCAYQQGDLKACDTPGQHNVPASFTNEYQNTGYVKTVTVGTEGEIIATSQNIRLDKKSSFTYTLKPTLQPDGSCRWFIDDSKSDSCKRYHLC